MTARVAMPRLLVVDDDPSARALCAALLRELFPAGVDIVSVASGEEAVAALRDGRFHAVLADYQLGRMDGVELLSRASGEHPSAARILFTGHASLELAREALDRARVHALVLKPLRLAALREALRHAAGVAAG